MIKETSSMAERLAEMVARHPAVASGVAGGAAAAGGEAVMRASDDNQWSSQPLSARLKYLMDAHKRPSLLNNKMACFVAQSMAERLAEMVARHPAVASGVAGGAAAAGGEAVMRASDDNQWSSQPLSARLKYLMDAHKRPSLLNNKMACFVAQSMADDMEKSAAGLGGALAVEAPGKMHDNAAYAQQQQHPIRSWLAQRLAGAPKLQRRSYMNPFS